MFRDLALRQISSFELSVAVPWAAWPQVGCLGAVWWHIVGYLVWVVGWVMGGKISWSDCDRVRVSYSLTEKDVRLSLSFVENRQ